TRMAISEAAVGLMMGLSVQLVFEGMQIAGQLAGAQLGFSLAAIIDPLTNIDTPVRGSMIAAREKPSCAPASCPAICMPSNTNCTERPIIKPTAASLIAIRVQPEMLSCISGTGQMPYSIAVRTKVKPTFTRAGTASLPKKG